MNVADALVTKSFDDGEVIIKQVGLNDQHISTNQMS